VSSEALFVMTGEPAPSTSVHPHTLDVPSPPHVYGAWQVPQSSVPPQPLGTVPHVLPRLAQVPGVHVVAHV
jgi:hypothetical protein